MHLKGVAFSLDMSIITFNDPLTNNVVNFEQPAPVGNCMLKSLGNDVSITTCEEIV